MAGLLGAQFRPTMLSSLPAMPVLQHYYSWPLEALPAPSFSSLTLAPAVAASPVVDTASHSGAVLDGAVPLASTGRKCKWLRQALLTSLLG